MELQWSATRSGTFIPVELLSGTHWIGKYVVRWDSVNVLEKNILPLPGIENFAAASPLVVSLQYLRYAAFR